MLEARRTRILRSQTADCTPATPCLFGVSVDAGRSSPETLGAGWRWTFSRFQTCALLLGDSLQRLTLEAQLGLSADEARDEACRRAEQMLLNFQSGLGCPAPVIRTSEIASTPAYPAALARFRQVFANRSNFRESVEGDAAQFCARQARRGRLAVDFDTACGLAVRYLLEEIAVYDVLAGEGWLAEVYQGSEVGTLARFIRGELPGLSRALERRTHISIRVSRLQDAA